MTFIDKFWGGDYDFTWVGSSAGADPQLQFFENFPGHLGAAFAAVSDRTLSIHAVNIPLSLSFNYPTLLFVGNNDNSLFSTHTRNNSYSFGLYSLNGSTLSLANSASTLISIGVGAAEFTSWYSMATSATQNITPGAWYFARNVSSAGIAVKSARHLINSSINPANAIPGGFLMGRMTASTGVMPGSIATSDLDITGSDAIRQPYIIVTA